ncbi:YceI family protein [Streptomyces carpinensis]|uniref:YceI family protein n=1 Tax=Streptomyces carpinensis TaxID=66369 RepID=A0ABV1WCL5_9ACTN|nr:YceI family protein [Streptomyces carpinensis]
MRHTGPAENHGGFNHFSGSPWATGRLWDSWIGHCVEAGGVDTGRPQGDGHLRSPDVFGVAAQPYPILTGGSAGPPRRFAHVPLTVRTYVADVPLTG